MPVDVEIRGSVPGLPHRELAAFARLCVDKLRASRALTWRPDEVAIVVVDDAEMQRLNRTWRGRNKTTDVLTFEGDHDTSVPGMPLSLGDIVISIDQAKRQAKQQRHSVATEVRYLILHGMIHALGFDHETDDGEMDALELRMRPRVGLS